MESGIGILILLIVGVPLALAIWLISRVVAAKNDIEDLTRRLRRLEAEVFRPKGDKTPEKAEESPYAPPTKTIVPEPVPEQRPWPVPESVYPKPPPVPEPPPSPITRPGVPEETEWTPPFKPKAPVNWEQFMGVKGFAWVGGLALFIGVAFFVKYSFDNNLVPPELRVAVGFLTGLALLVGGVKLSSRQNYPTLSQTLCATGIVILYAVTFACRSVYHFQFFGPLPTFLLMVLITTTAFFLAVRLNALVVAILGMLGGFVTPVLLSTGQDNPMGLFGYLAILDVGLIVVALHRRWFFLPALGALGTALMQIGWAEKFFVAGKYFDGHKILVALGVLLLFDAIWLVANGWLKARKSGGGDEPLVTAIAATNMRRWLAGSGLGLVAVTLAFTAWFLDFEPLAQQPWLMFAFVLLIDIIATGLALAEESMAAAHPITGLAVFGLLGFWTEQWLNNSMLNAALVFYFLFALVHSVLPAVLQRRGRMRAQSAANHIFPILALALVLFPIFKLAEISFLVWPFVLLVDLLAIALAVLTATLVPVLAVLLLTLAAVGVLIFKIPADLTGLPVSFFLLGAFGIFFAVASVWLVKKFRPDAFKTGIQFRPDAGTPDDLAVILPPSSIVLPFLLLIMVALRLPLTNPSPIFGMALLLVVLLLGITRLFSIEWMPAIGLACATALECVWHFNHFDPGLIHPPVSVVLTWYLIIYAVFALFPFLFAKRFSNKVIPWATAAMAGPPQFFLVHRFVAAVHPNQMMGLLPFAFALPGLASLVFVLKRFPAENKARLAQLAWFGGVALFFITLIFPIQFDRQWITIGWGLEGAALLWLFHRVPHPGVRLAGVGLLATAFVRLALNPAVMEYHARAATPIWNWYLYAYGIVTFCLFAGAKLLAPPRQLVLNINVPPILAGLGTVLAFILLNIEIADYFSPPGGVLTVEFGGNFAREMTYTIAWALFAFGLLVYGIVKQSAPARYPAMGLLCVTLLKLFFHDLAQLGQLYRIGAFIAVAVIAMLASFAYQKFFSSINKPSKNETAK